jgi:hypothetical protein
MFRKKKGCGNTKTKMVGWRFEECHRFDPDTELTGGSPVERRLKEGDRGGHVMKKSRSVTD